MIDGINKNLSLSCDPIHRYIAFVAKSAHSEAAERDLVDHAWTQRLREIHQLQTAWYVFPTAEHSRFQHVLGAMHLGGLFAEHLYDSLAEVCTDVPSREYVIATLRLVGLLHDVGHGPYGHFFDAHFLTRYDLNHEILGAHIIEHELGPLIRSIRETPTGSLVDSEQLDPAQIAWLIQRPKTHSAITSKGDGDTPGVPRWLLFLRTLLCGVYTIDNCDFVLRDAYMTGYSQYSYDLVRLLHYSFFSEYGLTISDRGIDGLVRFLGARSELFRSVYFHRTVRAIDLSLVDLFRESADLLFPGNPLDRLDDYQGFTEWSLVARVKGWRGSSDPRMQKLGARWLQFLSRKIDWKMMCQRSVIHARDEDEQTSIFTDPTFVEKRLRQRLPTDLRDAPLRVDVARHILRPYERAPTARLNFLYDSSRQIVRPLSDHQIYSKLPASQHICRVYGRDLRHQAEVSAALDELLGPCAADDLTNM